MAISHHGLLKISASAGSGKTYTLALRYIMLLLFEQRSDGLFDFRKQPAYHNHILAITFTNKATNEMKERIVEKLYELAETPEKSEFLRDFRALQRDEQCFADGVLDQQRVQDAARQALTALLYGYGAFNVSTIDSFFQTIMRSFARELDRDYNYAVQIDEKLAMKIAVHNFLLSLGADMVRRGTARQLNEVENWVQDFIRQRIQDGLDWNIFRDEGVLLSFAQLMTREVFSQQMPELHKYLTREDNGQRVADLSRSREFKRLVVQRINQLEQQYKDQANGMTLLVERHQIDTNKIYKGRLVDNLMKVDNPIARGEQYDLMAAATEIQLGETSFSGGYCPPQQFVDEALQWCKDVSAIWWRMAVLKRLLNDLGLLALLNRIDENLKQYGRETNQLLLADTNQLIASVLKSGVPFIYERVGTWINHFMIDEFQDTSRKQYENFKPLIEEALAHGRENLCMIIGDAKQSIYRFRNAEPGLFRDQIDIDFSQGRAQMHTQILDANYRSCPAVVKFNNWLFEQMLNQAELKESQLFRRTYMPNGRLEDFQQLTKKQQPQGMVRVMFFGGKNDGDMTEEQIMQRLPQYLLELHKRFDWAKMGLLVNVHDDAKDIVQCIMQHNKTAAPDQQIAIASDEAMLLAKSPSVKLIVSLLKFINITQYRVDDEQGDDTQEQDEHREIAKQRLSEQKMVYVLKLFKQKMASGQYPDAGRALAECFDEANKSLRSKAAQVSEYVSEIEKLMPHQPTQLMTLPSIVEHIITQFLPHVGDKAQETAHLLAFQDCVDDFDTQRGGGTVREFLYYWEQKKKKLTVPASGSTDAIRVMTIHAAKGLEFECVVIPKADWYIKKETNKACKEAFWVPRDQFMQQGGMKLFEPIEIPQQLIPPLLPLGKNAARALADEGLCLTQFVNEYYQNLLVDNLDKTYVAFTRPKQEMHIMADETSEVGALLKEIMQAGAADSSVELEDDGTGVYQWGAPRDISLDKPDNKNKVVQVFPMPHYRVCCQAADSEHFAVKLPQDVTDKQNTGNRLHNLMSRIAYRRDVDRAIGFCINRGIIRDNDPEWPLQRIKAFIQRMFSDPRTRDWFADDNKVYNERNLSPGHVDKMHKMKRPDRVVMRPDGTWIVIDYKFGEKNQADNEMQVMEYMKLLSKNGKSPIKGFLWYVDLDEVDEVKTNHS